MSERVCQWCGAPATTTVLAIVAEFKTVKGIKTQTEPEVRADACETCAGVDRGPAPEPTVVRARRAAAAKKWKAAQEKLL